MCAPGRPAMIRAGQSQTGSVQAFPGCAGDILCSRLKNGVFLTVPERQVSVNATELFVSGFRRLTCQASC